MPYVHPALLEHLPPDVREGFMRYMGAGQGDSSGAEGTSSSDTSDDEYNGGVSSVAERIRFRRSKVKFSKTLQQLCLDFIIGNQKAMAKDHVKAFRHAALKCPKALDLVLAAIRPGDILQEHFIIHHEYFNRSHYEKDFLKLLLHKGTSEVCLDLLKEGDIDEQLWTFLIRRCPKLKKIVIQHRCKSEILPIKSLLMLRHLEHIRLNNFAISNRYLESIGKEFPNLRFLEIDFFNMKPSDFALMKRMSKLEHLVYQLSFDREVSKSELKDRDADFIEYCLANLPKLQTVFCCSYRNPPGIQEALKAFHKKRPGAVLGLKNIMIEEELKIPAACVPNLRTVRVKGPLVRAAGLDELRNLQKLDVCVTTAESLETILKSVGKQLSALRICNEFYCTEIEREDQYFDFYTIFHYCPNLERFFMKGVKFSENPSMRISSDNFRNLKVVDISLYDMHGYQMPLPIMEYILRAEKLEDLSIYWAKCFPKALANVLSADKNKKYLQNLKRLSAQKMWVRNTKNYINQLKKLILRAPKLATLEVVCRGQGKDDFRRSGLKELCSHISGMQFLTDYDDGVGPSDPASHLDVHGFSINLGEMMKSHSKSK